MVSRSRRWGQWLHKTESPPISASSGHCLLTEWAHLSLSPSVVHGVPLTQPHHKVLSFYVLLVLPITQLSSHPLCMHSTHWQPYYTCIVLLSEHCTISNSMHTLHCLYMSAAYSEHHYILKYHSTGFQCIWLHHIVLFFTLTGFLFHSILSATSCLYPNTLKIVTLNYDLIML